MKTAKYPSGAIALLAENKNEVHVLNTLFLWGSPPVGTGRTGVEVTQINGNVVTKLMDYIKFRKPERPYRMEPDDMVYPEHTSIELWHIKKYNLLLGGLSSYCQKHKLPLNKELSTKVYKEMNRLFNIDNAREAHLDMIEHGIFN